MLNKEQCKMILDVMLSTGGDLAEIFEEKKHKSNYTLINNKVENVNSGIIYGIGLRIYSNLTSVYAYTNDQSMENLLKTAANLAKGVHGNTIIKSKDLEDVIFEDIHKIEKRPLDFDINYKLDIMKKASNSAFAYDEIIKKVIVYYIDEDQSVLIANSDGKYAFDNRVRTRLMINSIAQSEDKMQDGVASKGAHMGLELYDSIDIEALAQESARIAKTMLFADECPSGVMDVVIDNGFGGVIFHEACGHALEASSVAKGMSVFADKLGTQIASECVSAVDDATIPNAWGSNNIDDEGNLTKRNVLIENGILKGYLVDTLNGRRMNMPSTGSSRKQGYMYEQTSRMSNTFILNGNSNFDEIIANTKFGLYAKALGGGSVNPSTGDFNFAVNEGYLIEDGKITKPLKGATLVGNGAKILMQIDMVGNNCSRQQGMCGSSSGSIPTDVGQPTIRVKAMSVGGRGGAI